LIKEVDLKAIFRYHLKSFLKDYGLTMLSMRLMRFGAKKKPFYRIVVMESKSPRQSRAKDFIGTYNPLKAPAEIQIDHEKANYWLQKGARASQTVQSLLNKATKSTSVPLKHS
jgi:small subunit ribosomal protein S16